MSENRHIRYMLKDTAAIEDFDSESLVFLAIERLLRFK
jgi:hypothetical protein